MNLLFLTQCHHHTAMNPPRPTREWIENCCFGWKVFISLDLAYSVVIAVSGPLKPREGYQRNIKFTRGKQVGIWSEKRIGHSPLKGSIFSESFQNFHRMCMSCRLSNFDRDLWRMPELVYLETVHSNFGQLSSLTCPKATTDSSLDSEGSWNQDEAVIF